MICVFAELLGPLLPLVSPNVAVVVGTVGLCLIALELNRPGTIVPGALGLLLVLCAVPAFAGQSLQPWPAFLLLAATLLLLLNLWYQVPAWLLLLATLALPYGMRFLVPAGASEVAWSVAVLCGLTLGTLGASLSRVALRARRAKRVN